MKGSKISGRDLAYLLALTLPLAACASTYTYTQPPPRETSTSPVLQYSVINVSPEGTSLDESALKIYLDTETGPPTWLRDGGSTYRHLKYRAIGAIALSTPDVDIAFGFTPTSMTADARGVLSGPLALQLVFKNKGTRVITLDWNSVVLTDELGRAHRVIHRGVKLSDTAASMAPSVIPPGSILEDFAYPSEGIGYSPGRYGGWFAAIFFETRQPGAQLKLYLPLRLGAEEKAYTFTFASGSLKD